MEEKDLNSVANIEIEPLSDDDLELVSGGCEMNSCSADCCSSPPGGPIDGLS